MDESQATFRPGFDTNEPSPELQRVLKEGWIQPCRALELGCGTGTNALFLASQGFDVTGIDMSAEFLQRARAKADRAGGAVRFVEADAFHLPDLGPRFPFVFSRGLYHRLRAQNRFRCWEVMASVTEPGGFHLMLVPNANVSEPGTPRPVTSVFHYELCLELSEAFDLVQLREFRFQHMVRLGLAGEGVRPLGWSVLLRRKRGLPETDHSSQKSEIAAGARASEVDKDLEGNWIVVSAEIDGRPFTQLAEARFTFVADKLTIKNRGRAMQIACALQPAKNPREIYLAGFGGRPSIGIYKVEGEELTLSLVPEKEGPQPSDFVTKSGRTVIVLRREKP
jgi:uncharacterized protein (TIGR03067 family)